MKTQEHTAGPWRIGEYGKVVGPDGTMIPVCGVSMPMGHVPETHVGYANARLVAAAPQLLEALERLIADLPTKRDWLDPVIEAMAKDAIKSAKGETL